MNGKEFLKAVDMLEKEKHIDRNYIFESMEQSLANAYKKHSGGKQNVEVKIDKGTGDIKIYSYQTVVSEINEEEDLDSQILLEDALKIDKTKNIGDKIYEEVDPGDFGRVATSSAKQLLIQKIREAERNSIIDEFSNKEGELISGVCDLEDEGNYYINLGRVNGVLPKSELIGDEKLEMGSVIKAYVTKVELDSKGTLIKLSRKHFNFVKRLFEIEIPELADGSIMIYSVAREPGVRSKVAVYSSYANIDPIGCCIGEKGKRISNIIKELNGEKLDIVKYDEDKEKFITNALSPAKNIKVFILDPNKQEALAIADGEDFSLALGKKGQNVRLASRLTKFKIDVKTTEQAKEMGISIK